MESLCDLLVSPPPLLLVTYPCGVCIAEWRLHITHFLSSALKKPPLCFNQSETTLSRCTNLFLHFEKLQLTDTINYGSILQEMVQY